MGTVADMMIPQAKLTMMFAEKVVDGISPERFRRKLDGVECNSPAFNIGHLAIYPENILEMLGQKDKTADNSAFAALFDYGCECKDDPDGTIYPGRDEIVERFMTRADAAINAFAEAPDDVLSRENPSEQMRDMFPTVGSFAGFLLAAHPMMHLGQISTWRRVEGMGPCM